MNVGPDGHFSDPGTFGTNGYSLTLALSSSADSTATGVRNEEAAWWFRRNMTLMLSPYHLHTAAVCWEKSALAA